MDIVLCVCVCQAAGSLEDNGATGGPNPKLSPKSTLT